MSKGSDEVVFATAVAVAAEPARVPKPSNELLAVITPFCQGYAQQHGNEFEAVVNDLVQWAMAEAPKFNMAWEEFIRAFVQEKAQEANANAAEEPLPTPLNKDQETTTHDNRNLEFLISRLEKVAMSMESDRNAEISMLKSSLEEAREKFEKETFSLIKETSSLKKEISDQKRVLELRKEISDQKKVLDELRAWDTVNITWKISTFDKEIYSSSFNVAQHTLRMNMRLVGDKRYGYLGFFICHTKGCGHGNDRFPIQIGGSSISLVGNGNEDTVTKHYGENAVIEEAGRGVGFSEFLSMKDFAKKIVDDGEITLKAKIRVRRSTVANLNLDTTDYRGNLLQVGGNLLQIGA